MYAYHPWCKKVNGDRVQIFSNTPKNAVYFGFFIYAFALGSLFPRLADLQMQMGISKAELGLALAGLPAGVQITLLFADRLVRKIPFMLLLGMGAPLICLSQWLAALAGTPAAFFFCLALGGVSVALIEVAVNLEADRVEAQNGERIMNRSHAFWSFGFFGASILGAGFAQLGVSPLLHFAIVSGITACFTNFVFLKYKPAAPRYKTKVQKASVFVWPSKAVFLLVLFTLSGMLVEGSYIDWSIIFMRDEFDTLPFVEGLALIFAALSQALVRFFADPFVERYGSRLIAFISILFMALGVCLVSFATSFLIALIGFLFMGAGSAVIFPLAMSSAARRRDRTPEENVAALAQFAFVTFLVAPPILGFISEIYGLRIAFALALPFIFLSYFQLNVLKEKPFESGSKSPR